MHINDCNDGCNGERVGGWRIQSDRDLDVGRGLDGRSIAAWNTK